MTNDLTFTIIALEKVDAALGHVATELEMINAKLDRLNGQKATAEVEIKTDKASKGIDLIQSRWQAIAAGIVVASPLIGAAIEAGVGVGFIGLAAIAQKSNVDVKAAYTNLWQEVMGTTKSATDQLQPQLVGAAHGIAAAFNQLGPQMSQAFQAAGPEIVTLTHGITNLAHNAMPGLLASMQSNEPVMQALTTLMGTVGTVFSDTLTSLSRHSTEFAAVLHSLGSITQSVFGLATNLLNDLAVAYAANSQTIDSAIAGIASVASQLAAGVLPVLSLALSAVGGALTLLTGALGPLAPVLGVVAALFIAKKLAVDGVAAAMNFLVPKYNTLAEGVMKVTNVVREGTGAEQVAIDKHNLSSDAMRKSALAAAQKAVATAKDAGETARNNLVQLENLAANNANAVSVVRLTAARETAIAATEAEIVANRALATAERDAEASAGPLGWAILAVSTVIGVLMNSSDDAKVSTENLQSTIDSMTSAFERSHGAVDKSVIDSLTATPAFKAAADAAQKQGISQDQLTQAILGGGPALEGMRSGLQKIVDAHAQVATSTAAGRAGSIALRDANGDVTKSYDGVGQSAKDALDKLNAAVEGFNKGKVSAADLAQTQRTAGVALVASSEYQDSAANSAQNLGLKITTVSEGFRKIIAEGGAASSSVLDVGQAFDQLQIKVSAAENAISDHFHQADLAVVQAKQAVVDAGHSQEKAAQGVADAHHSEEQAARAVTAANEGVANASHAVEMAQRSLQDAYANVSVAQDTYAKAVEKEKVAETALHQAREQAVQDLKAIHLQLEDQIQSEESANVRLFESQQNALSFGINASNVHGIAAQKVDWSNIDKVKAAIDLVSAQNAVNDTLNKGANLREDVAAADAAGVDGAKNVIAAQDAVVNAQNQVKSSANALIKANQQVGDASYALQQAQAGLTKAHQAVADAAWGAQKAHQAVRDAQYQQGKAAEALKLAQEKLKVAQDDASRSLDLSTKAGQANYGLLQTLATAIKNEFGPSAEGYNTLIQKTADKFGITTGAAEDLLKKLHDIPQDFHFGMTAVASANFDELNRVYNDKFGGHIGPISPNVAHAFAGGGPVPGGGGARADDQLIWASSREWVQPVDAVDYYGAGFMKAVQTKQFPKFATGGPVDPARINMLFSGAGVGYQTSVDALGVMGFPHPPNLEKYVPPPVFIDMGSNASFSPGGGVARWSGTVLGVMHMLGLPDGILGKVVRRLQLESGGNPTIVNNWDTNWQAGHPSVGLMQPIRKTFQDYAGPYVNTGPFSYGVSVDPAANIYAGLNYSGHRYASHGGFLGGVIYGMDKPGGYDNGGPLPPGMSTVWNGTGKPENVRNADQEDRILAALRENPRTERHYHLTVYNAANNEVNLRAQFKRLEIESGML